MKQIVVISGKGGTGKTVVTGSLAALARNKIMVDCDVDAADLHLLLNPKIKETHEFRSGKTAFIDPRLCLKCGKCIKFCRFKAIKPDYSIEPYSCEGCSLCSHICPFNAIQMKYNISGEWFISETKYGHFVHAKLGIAEENSGKLVAKIRQAGRDLAKQYNLDYIIIDGPPGIGCPVIASLTGVNSALIVTEPTLSGLHDAQRVIAVARHFNVPVKMVINKYDLNLDMTYKIENFCTLQNIPVVGEIIFDKQVVESMVAGKPIVEYITGSVKKELVKIWEQLK
ncbi:(4Fe-4S)-binding protein [candidate division WOR-1 bacterium RIFOXYD2_FULL_36_8]|uniref:(4Fe-4S)-binding protein n=1 Tax=candidate division WOR-1 bacterium RIFOXYB2_FULL_36_35 TaxID=1802578 RepID=A0A1F4S147_UNCSA|nr:MAG: (4Fe-4S)-binding protein [candidate division WOR-1 bacterium RIFOXYA2_FULL_36_21]OGC14109.1 MAG: (4Fe-4S)-binding protein [candidate division WOR-1 bacterium RIFOXYB2_FULL_36_35]OGC16515.1 MAG: (4Fe-4S)-binding protein [candidate division WOR-1 bacterium RIFOXYA12_FULL_36_13]OGC39711.1 MAG: (4Fe-4S)-binding protein [candidate division WOR-1 bacterium RIFOXYD2_FULL_36_8]